jgi:hypothetical protein
VTISLQNLKSENCRRDYTTALSQKGEIVVLNKTEWSPHKQQSSDGDTVYYWLEPRGWWNVKTVFPENIQNSALFLGVLENVLSIAEVVWMAARDHERLRQTTTRLGGTLITFIARYSNCGSIHFYPQVDPRESGENGSVTGGGLIAVTASGCRPTHNTCPDRNIFTWLSNWASSHLCLGLSNCLFLSGFQTKILCEFLISHNCATCPNYLIFRDLISLLIFGDSCSEIMKFLIMQHNLMIWLRDTV